MLKPRFQGSVRFCVETEQILLSIAVELRLLQMLLNRTRGWSKQDQETWILVALKCLFSKGKLIKDANPTPPPPTLHLCSETLSSLCEILGLLRNWHLHTSYWPHPLWIGSIYCRLTNPKIDSSAVTILKTIDSEQRRGEAKVSQITDQEFGGCCSVSKAVDL